MDNQNTLPAVAGQDKFFAIIQSLAANPDVPVDKLQKIMDMQERILDRDAEALYNAAMVRAQKKMPLVKEDRRNDSTGSMYSDYSTIVKTCAPIYTSEGFSVSFYEGETPKEGEIRVCADIMHEGGHTKTRYADIPLDDSGIKGATNKTRTHAKGSSFSYARSYLIKLIFNIPTGDDDNGNGAGSTYITEDQANTLHALVMENNIGGDQFLAGLLKYLKVEKLDLILSKDFGKARAAIQSAITKKAELKKEGPK